MARIEIADKLGVELIATDTLPGSGIAKYLRAETAKFFASAELGVALLTPLSKLKADPLGFAMKFADAGVFGTSGVDWKFSAESRVAVIPWPGGVAVSFTPSLSAGTGAQSSGLKFGFSAGGSVEYRASRPFPDRTLLLKDALRSILASGVIPATVLDVLQMPEGDAASITGTGNLKLSAAFPIARSINPLAVPGVPFGDLAKLQIDAGASVSVGASVGVRGQYEVKVRKLAGNKAVVAYRKTAGSQFQFDVRAAVGTSLSAFGEDVLPRLIGLVADDPAIDPQSDLAAAVAASLNRTIELSLLGSFATESEDTEIFEYEFDLDRLDATGIGALNDALQANLSGLTSAASTELPHGVRMLKSAFEETRKRSVRWKVNLLGIVNASGLSELIRTGRTLFNAESGELIVTDSVTAKRLEVTTYPLAADPEKTGHLLLQSMVVTAAYRASGASLLTSELSGSISYFEQTSNATRQKISDYLDNLLGCGLIDGAGKAAFLANPAAGRASVSLEAEFSNENFRAMFLDGKKKARKREYFESIGRDAVAAIVQPKDPNDFRRLPMLTGDAKSNELWRQMTDAGQANIARVVPKAVSSGIPLQLLISDYTVIRWWSKAMRAAAEEVERMDGFLAGNKKSPEVLARDKDFRKRREAMSKRLADVADESLPGLLDAWGVVAMYSASGSKSRVRGLISTRGAVLREELLDSESILAP